MAMGFGVDADSAYDLAQRPRYAIALVSFAIFGLWRYIYNYGMFPYVNKVTLFVNNILCLFFVFFFLTLVYQR